MRDAAGSQRVDQAASRELNQAFETWLRWPLWRHTLAVLGLLAVIFALWWDYHLYAEPLADERNYIAGFEAIRAGRQPYVAGYLYPPVVAFAGAWWLDLVGMGATLGVIRVANAVGLALMVWIAVAWAPLRMRWRWIWGAGVIVASPAVWLGVRWGNLSLAVGGLIVWALVFWREHPLGSTVALGSSVGLKPIAPLAIGLLLLHRPAAGGRRHHLIAIVALALGFTLMFGFPYVHEMLALGQGGLEHRSASIHRIAFLIFGPGQGLWVSAAVGLGATLVIWRCGPLGRLQLVAVAIAATLTATPLVWGHTHLLSLPLQAGALSLLWLRRGRRLRYEVVAIVLAVLASHLAQGVTGVYDHHIVLQVAGTLPPVAAPILLAWYLVRYADAV